MAANIFTLPKEDLEQIIQTACRDFQSLHRARFFLTGCTGFFGKWLIESLLAANHELSLGLHLTILSRNPAKLCATLPYLEANKSVKLLKGDIISVNLSALKTCTHIIHGANLPYDGSLSWPLEHMNVAITGTRRILENATGEHPSMLLLSSGAVYKTLESVGGPRAPDAAFKEQQVVNASYLKEAEVYSLTKRFLESYATALGGEHGITVSIARCFAFSGPYIPLHSTQALGNFIYQAITGQDIVIKGDGTPVRSYMYGADMVVWLLALLARGAHGVPYNVGSQEAHSIAETASIVAKVAPQALAVKILSDSSVIGNAPSVYVPDTTLAQQELALHCNVSLEQSVIKMFAWLKDKKFV